MHWHDVSLCFVSHAELRVRTMLGVCHPPHTFMWTSLKSWSICLLVVVLSLSEPTYAHLSGCYVHTQAMIYAFIMATLSILHYHTAFIRSACGLFIVVYFGHQHFRQMLPWQITEIIIHVLCRIAPSHSGFSIRVSPFPIVWCICIIGSGLFKHLHSKILKWMLTV